MPGWWNGIHARLKSVSPKGIRVRVPFQAQLCDIILHMSPRRIESRSLDRNGTETTVIRENPIGFTVGSTDAARILGVTRTTLFRHGEQDVERVHPARRRGHKEWDREYSDSALLRLAHETRKAQIRPDDNQEFTVLSTKNTETVLNIKWREADKK